MVEERNIYLESKQEDKGNGYYKRGFVTRFGKLELEVPRTRNGEFRPFMLGERDIKEGVKILKSF